MSKFESFKENLGITIFMIILIVFFLGFGYMVKKELIDKESVLSSVINKGSDEKSDIDKLIDKQKDDVTTNDIDDNTTEKSSDKTLEEESENVNADIDSTEDYKTYPSVLCSYAGYLEDTKLVYSESYNAFFESDGTVSWIKYSYYFDFSEHKDVYNQLYKDGYFDDMYDLYSKIGKITLNESNYSVSYEVEKDEFLKIDGIPFSNSSELTYELFAKKMKTLGYTCKDE